MALKRSRTIAGTLQHAPAEVHSRSGARARSSRPSCALSRSISAALLFWLTASGAAAGLSAAGGVPVSAGLLDADDLDAACWVFALPLLMCFSSRRRLTGRDFLHLGELVFHRALLGYFK
jgi:hypothetical protein